ncbi:hypothetical protein VTL71DRAFT_3638 [Oculimacula yallundae]|uniref:Zn(2)-C6 fungal-type domain-containing protein n=1 Tax=Oculimacula yallundae TaxID=86028 RepID=A0ABR4C7S7_9HELO
MSTPAIQPSAVPTWEESVVDRVLSGEPSLSKFPASKSRRKQHRSCDQCRKGKKGCDAIVLKGFANDTADLGQGLLPLGPCSSCTKTSKNCTFTWLFSQEKDRIRRTNDGSGRLYSKHAKRQGTTDIQPNVLSPDIRRPLDGAGEPGTKKVRRGGNGQSEDFSNIYLEQSQLTRSPPTLHWDFDHNSERESVFASPETFSSSSQTLDNRRASFEEGTAQQPSSFSNYIWSEDPNAAPLGRSPSTSSNTWRTQTRTTRPLKRPKQFLADISPFSISDNLATFTNQSLMTENLMKVYHDSMENALSCWLTERTCPYGDQAVTSHGASSINTSMLREWGPDWSNRICRQVINIDRKLAVMQDRPLTRLEDKAASNALNLAIMAFATQWSQSSERSRAKFQPMHTVNDHVAHEFTPPTMEFDRIMQETMWAQARRAIQDATHIESSRVVLAHIVFALTQRPLDVNQYSPSTRPETKKAFSRGSHTMSSPESKDTLDSSSEATDREEHSRLIGEIEDVIEQDGSPVFLEQGLRQIHALRCKVDSTSAQLTQEDRKTVDLLYWLGIMFDTLSAAMHKRPLVVSDEDSDIHRENPHSPDLQRQHDRQNSQSSVTEQQNIPSRLMLAPSSKLWSSFFFQEQAPRNSALPIRWPCSYQAAATTLADAAPIKVLLFRKITKIQTLISRHLHGEQLEEAIEDALKVHKYWNAFYGPFMLDCVAHHDQLPARIQSWYICLTGHWYLAVLLLADIIHLIDSERQLSLESQRRWRKSCGLVTALRQCTAHAVAELARCACPREDASFPDAGGFHFALNQGALLTEPWTQVMIRVFAKAGALLLADATPSQYKVDAEKPYEQALVQIESCVEALWYLGRKSDMAFLAARVLAEALKDTKEKIVTFQMSQFSGDRLEPDFSMEGEFSFSVSSAETDCSITQTDGEVEFGSMDKEMMQNFRLGLLGVDTFRSFI